MNLLNNFTFAHFFQMNSTDLSISGDISIASKFPVEISYKHFHKHSRNCHCIWLLFLRIIRFFRAGIDPENWSWSGRTVTDRIESVEKINWTLRDRNFISWKCWKTFSVNLVFVHKTKIPHIFLIKFIKKCSKRMVF